VQRRSSASRRSVATAKALRRQRSPSLFRQQCLGRARLCPPQARLCVHRRRLRIRFRPNERLRCRRGRVGRTRSRVSLRAPLPQSPMERVRSTVGTSARPRSNSRCFLDLGVASSPLRVERTSIAAAGDEFTPERRRARARALGRGDGSRHLHERRSGALSRRAPTI